VIEFLLLKFFVVHVSFSFLVFVWPSKKGETAGETAGKRWRGPCKSSDGQLARTCRTALDSGGCAGEMDKLN
jgi:hypothetical protein